MNPVVIRGKNKPIIMEVIGKEGQKVAEYVDNNKEHKVPYQLITERVTL